jgi:hypothetical protein
VGLHVMIAFSTLASYFHSMIESIWIYTWDETEKRVDSIQQRMTFLHRRIQRRVQVNQALHPIYNRNSMHRRSNPLCLKSEDRM